MREQGIVGRPGLKKRAPPEVAAAAARVEIRVEPVEEPRPESRLRLAQAKQPQRRLLEEIVPEEQLVRTLTGEHHFDVPLAREFREQVHGSRGGAHQRRFGVPDDVRKDGGHVTESDRAHEMMTVQLSGHEQLELAFVELRIVERDGERTQWERRLPRGERAADRRIEPAAQIPTDGNVRAEAQRDATLEQAAEGRDRVGSFLPRLRVLQVVVAAVAQSAVTPDGEATWLDGVHALEHGPRGTGGPEGEDLIEAHGIERGLDLAAREQRLGLRGEHQIPVRDAVEERPDAEPISREEHRFRTTIVNRERELPVQAGQHPRAPLLVRMDEHFRIAAGAEAMPGGLQVGPQLEVVVDLAVVDDEHGAVLIPEGLPPAGDVDDAEAHVSQADPRSEE